MKKLFFVATVALVFASCSKDQMAVKKLDGTWLVTEASYSYGGVSYTPTEDDETVEYTFENCKLADEEYCSASITYTDEDGSSTDNQVFKVTNDGTTLIMQSDAESTNSAEYTIEDLSRKELSLSLSEDGLTAELELEKQ